MPKFVLDSDGETFLKINFMDLILALLDLNIWNWSRKSLVYKHPQVILMHVIKGPLFGNPLYQRPKTEWGTVFVFKGCTKWHIEQYAPPTFLTALYSWLLFYSWCVFSLKCLLLLSATKLLSILQDLFKCENWNYVP